MPLTAQQFGVFSTDYIPGYSGPGTGGQELLGYNRLQEQQRQFDEMQAWREEKERLRIAENARVRGEAALQEYTALMGQGRQAEAEASLARLRDLGYDVAQNPDGTIGIQYRPTGSQLLVEQEPFRSSQVMQGTTEIPTSPTRQGQVQQEFGQDMDVSSYERDLEMMERDAAPQPQQEPLQADEYLGEGQRQLPDFEMRNRTRYDLAGTGLDPSLPVFIGGALGVSPRLEGEVVSRTGLETTPAPRGARQDPNLTAKVQAAGARATADEGAQKDVVNQVLLDKIREHYQEGAEPEVQMEDPYAEYQGPMAPPVPVNAQAAAMQIGAGIDPGRLAQLRLSRRAPWHAAMGQQYPESSGLAAAGLGTDQTLEASQRATQEHYLANARNKAALERAKVMAGRPRGGMQIVMKESEARLTEQRAEKLIEATKRYWKIPDNAHSYREGRAVLEQLKKGNVPLDAMAMTKLIRASGDVRPSDADRHALVQGLQHAGLPSLAASIYESIRTNSTWKPVEMNPAKRAQFLEAVEVILDDTDRRIDQGFDAMIDIYETSGATQQRNLILQHMSMMFPERYDEAVQQGRIQENIHGREVVEMLPGEQVGSKASRTLYGAAPKFESKQEAEPTGGNSSAKEMLKRMREARQKGQK